MATLRFVETIPNQRQYNLILFEPISVLASTLFSMSRIDMILLLVTDLTQTTHHSQAPE